MKAMSKPVLFIATSPGLPSDSPREYRIFVSGKQDEPKGYHQWFVQISRTTHSDYSLPPIGII